MKVKSIWVTESPSVFDPAGEFFAAIYYLEGMNTIGRVAVRASTQDEGDIAIDRAIHHLEKEFGKADEIVRTPEQRAAHAACMVRQILG